MKYSPTSIEIEEELRQERKKLRYVRTMSSTFFVLVIAAALAILIAMLWLPVLQIYGTSMTPTLKEGEIVISLKDSKFRQGDVVAFYYGNKLLVKRCIAGPGSWVDIKGDGTVWVDGVALEEPYVSEKTLGNSDIEYPYQVPEEKYFLLGDHRATSIDSRYSSVGCVAVEQIVGKIVFRVWPLDGLGEIN